MEKPKVVQVTVPNFPNLIKHVAVYCRVSSGLREQLDSLSAQISGFVRMVAGHFDMRLVDIYIDVVSGEKSNRAEFNRMLSDAESGRFNLLLTKSISRFGRNTEDTIIALRFLKSQNVQVIFDEENIDTFKDDSEFVVSILAGYAQAENESRRQNQLWSIKKALEDGSSELYSRTCYGYKKDKNGVIVIAHDEAVVVQLIFSSYLNGESILGIQRILQERGIPSPRGKDVWSKRGIEEVLTREKYAGSVIARKTITSNEKNHKRVKNLTEPMYLMTDVFPAIITQEIFDAVQAEKDRRSNIIKDETGTYRKSTHYSSKRSGSNNT